MEEKEKQTEYSIEISANITAQILIPDGIKEDVVAGNYTYVRGEEEC